MRKYENFGGAWAMSSISEFTIDLHGAARTIPAPEVWNALGMLQVDQWESGHTQDQKIDSVPVTIQRRGWRMVVWGRGEAEPTLEASPALPPPPDYDPTDASAPARIVPMKGVTLEQPIAVNAIAKSDAVAASPLDTPSTPVRDTRSPVPWAAIAAAPLLAFVIGWWLNSWVVMGLVYVLLVALAALVRRVR